MNLNGDLVVITAREAYELLLLAFNPFDAYDFLAEEGCDPHPDAETTWISFGRIGLITSAPDSR